MNKNGLSRRVCCNSGKWIRLVSFCAALLLLLIPLRSQAFQTIVVIENQAASKRVSVVSASISNPYLEVLASVSGGFVMGTTAGNPASSLDDDLPLLYGYALDTVDIGSSFATLRDC
jgi:hypothetical protein